MKKFLINNKNDFINILFSILYTFATLWFLKLLLNFETSNIFLKSFYYLINILFSCFVFAITVFLLKKFITIEINLRIYFNISLYETAIISSYKNNDAATILLLIIFAFTFYLILEFFISKINTKKKNKIENNEFVYKYKKIDDFLFKTLEEEKIWLSHPNELNDPFDSKVIISEKDKEECLNLLKDYLAYKSFANILNNKDSDKKIINKLLLKYVKKCNKFLEKHNYFPTNVHFYKFLKNNDDKEKINLFENELHRTFEKEIIEPFDKISNLSLIGSFTQRNDSILMRSHYADGGKGVCLEIENQSSFYSVTYVEQRPFISLKDHIKNQLCNNHSKDDKFIKDILACYYIKYKDWSYEKEIRCVKYFEKDEDRYLNVKIKRVLIGPYVDSENIEKIKEICSKKNIEYSFVKQDQDEYKIVKTDNTDK